MVFFGDAGEKLKNTGINAARGLSSRRLYREYKWFLLAATFIVAIMLAAFAFRQEMERLKELGYAGAFVANVISSSSILLPLPGALVVFALGSLSNPLLVGIAGGLGAALGEGSGYIMGLGGRHLVEKSRVYLKLEGWMERHGSLTIWLMSLIPFTPFDLAGIAAGALRFPAWKFLLFCALGKVPRFILIAYSGAWGVGLVSRFLG